ncbi:MAG: disulfide bond formation protein B [Deltaproteobacteria bacterium]|nr:disulfide bond formation protein B [Deltaproteobacteria bacterium]MCK5709839.1 disulfide bond formation protein B [Deltaproteobacteria bacterium]
MTPSLATRINSFAVLGICGVLLGAYYIQFVEGEFPCPLCLLQRLAMLGVAFGAMLNLRFGIRTRHYGVSLLSAIFGASVSIRQILLHIDPSDTGYGSPILGMHLYTWAFIIFAVVILLIGIMMFFETQFEETKDNKSTQNLSLFIKAVFFFVVLIAAANVATTFFECGFGQCPDNPTSYKELP